MKTFNKGYCEITILVIVSMLAVLMIALITSLPPNNAHNTPFQLGGKTTDTVVYRNMEDCLREYAREVCEQDMVKPLNSPVNSSMIPQMLAMRLFQSTTSNSNSMLKPVTQYVPVEIKIPSGTYTGRLATKVTETKIPNNTKSPQVTQSNKTYTQTVQPKKPSTFRSPIRVPMKRSFGRR